MKLNAKAYYRLVLMLGLTILTQLLLIVKSSTIAALFGVSIEMDAYNFVNSVASFVFCFLGVGVSNVLVPRIVNNTSDLRSQNSFLTILYGAALVVLILIVILCRPILNVFGGYSSDFISIASNLIAIVMLGQFLNAINWVSLSYLQCKDSFIIPKVLALVATAALTIIILISNSLSITQYAIYSFILILLEVVSQYYFAIQKGFRYRPMLLRKDAELQLLFRTFWPTVFGSGVYQLTLMVDSFVSSTLGTGNISILSYSNTISGMVNTVISSNIMLYIYPKIASEVNDENGKKKLFQYMTFFAALLCAVVVLFVAAGHDAVRILFERGKFQSDATQGVFVCVLIYLIGAPVNVMRDTVYRYFFSKGNTKSTFYNGLAASILNIVISIILSRFMGLYGIVLGTTITAAFSFVSILLRMKKQYTFGGHFPFFAKELLKLIAATAAAVVGCLLVKWIPLGWPSLAVSALAALVSLAIYGGVLFVSRSKVFQVELG